MPTESTPLRSHCIHDGIFHSPWPLAIFFPWCHVPSTRTWAIFFLQSLIITSPLSMGYVHKQTRMSSNHMAWCFMYSETRPHITVEFFHHHQSSINKSKTIDYHIIYWNILKNRSNGQVNPGLNTHSVLFLLLLISPTTCALSVGVKRSHWTF